MQQREKILLVCLVTALVFWWGRSVLLSSFIAPIEQQEQRLKSLRGELENRELQELAVLRATGKVTEFRDRSLPADPNAAQRAYAIWLTDLLENCGWEYHEVVPGKVTRFQDLGSVVQFSINGRANSEQLAKFLAGFEESGILHRLERLNLNADSVEPDSPLDISMIAEGISLSAANRPALEEVSTQPELTKFWQEFADHSPFTKKRPALVRNPQIVVPTVVNVNRGSRLQQKVDWSGFAPYELPLKLSLKQPIPEGLTFDPRLQILTWQTTVETEAKDYPVTILAETAAEDSIEKKLSVRVVIPNTTPTVEPVSAPAIVYPEEAWTYQIVAADKDEPAQQLTYSLSGTLPAGLTIDPQTGVLNWTPLSSLAGQNFMVTVNATDNGTPPLKASQTLNLQVKRDAEQSTYLMGCIQVDGGWTAWFEDRGQNRQFALKQGELLSAGRFEATLAEVAVDSILLTGPSGQQKLSLGQKLADRQPVAAPIPIPVVAPVPVPASDPDPVATE